MSTVPTVSVVIPTYNRLLRLQQVLAALSAQTYDHRRFEVVVVSDGSDDGTAEYLAGATTSFDLVSACQANAGPAAARNHGVELARGSLVLFLDDDVMAVPDLIAQHVRTQQRGTDDTVVIGPMLTPPDVRLSAWIEWEQAMLYKQYDALARGAYAPTYRQFYTGNASTRRSTILAIGGFDVRYRRAEDVELAYRLSEAGARFVFDAKAIGYHHADRSFQSWLQNARDYGTNEVTFASEHVKSGRLESTRDEFLSRHPLVRTMTRSCVARPWLLQMVERELGWVALMSDKVGAQRLTGHSLSGLYNLAYYSALADALGGPRSFLRLMGAAPGLPFGPQARSGSAVVEGH